MQNIIKSAVIGDPISHSLSPFLHQYLLNKYKIHGSYQAIEIKSQNLEEQINKMLFKENFAGFNITIPHKEKIFEIALKQNFKITKTVQIIKSANTIYKENNEIIVDNSDYFGFYKNLEFATNINFNKNKALIIGAGGASRAILYSLLKNNFKEIHITNRDIEKADQLKKEFITTKNQEIKIIKDLNSINDNDFDLIVNTTSLGMKNQPKLEIDLQKITNKNTIIYDIVYNPLITDFLKQAQNLNLKTITGIGMLIFQAFLGFEKWFKIKPELSNEEFEELTKILINRL